MTASFRGVRPLSTNPLRTRGGEGDGDGAKARQRKHKHEEAERCPEARRLSQQEKQEESSKLEVKPGKGKKVENLQSGAVHMWFTASL